MVYGTYDVMEMLRWLPNVTHSGELTRPKVAWYMVVKAVLLRSFLRPCLHQLRHLHVYKALIVCVTLMEMYLWTVSLYGMRK